MKVINANEEINAHEGYQYKWRLSMQKKVINANEGNQYKWR